MVIERNFFLCALVESTEQSEQLKENLKDEKQTRKRLESRVDHMEEELNDLKLEKEKLERVRSRNLSKFAQVQGLSEARSFGEKLSVPGD